MVRTRLTDVLKGWGRIDDAMVAQAVAVHRRAGTRIGEALVELGFCERGEVVNALAAQAGLSVVDLSRVALDPGAASRVPRRVAERHRVVPLRVDRLGTSLAVATAAPVSLEALDAVRAVSRLKVVPFIADERLIANALACAYADPDALELEQGEGNADDAPPLVTGPLASCIDGV